MKRFCLLMTILPLLVTACVSLQPLTTPTSTASLPPTAVPTHTQPPAPTDTPLPPAATATLAPATGTLTIKVNVRSGPATSYSSLGQLDSGQKVQVTLQDGTGGWYRIIYPSAPDGAGWVAAQFVQLSAGALVPQAPTPTPPGPQGQVQQLLNVRSGPGTTFDSLGMVQPYTTVSLTGKDATASWFQIKYPKGPGGFGWVTAQFVQTGDADKLPVLDQYGTPVPGSTSGPSGGQPTPTPTIGPAFNDGDSAASPAVQITFTSAGTRQFTYSGQVSAPQGDPQDWVQFTPFAVNANDAILIFSLTCTGNGSLTVTMQLAGAPLSAGSGLACGDTNKLLTLPAGKPITLELAPAPGDGLQFVNYTLTVENMP